MRTPIFLKFTKSVYSNFSIQTIYRNFLINTFCVVWTFLKVSKTGTCPYKCKSCEGVNSLEPSFSYRTVGRTFYIALGDRKNPLQILQDLPKITILA